MTDRHGSSEDPSRPDDSDGKRGLRCPAYGSVVVPGRRDARPDADWTARSLDYALGELDRMTASLELPATVRETAGAIYRRAFEDDFVRGRSIDGVVTAALYAACRLEDAPRSLEEMTEVSRVTQLEIARTYRRLTRELGLTIEPVDPARYVPRFCAELALGRTVQVRAVEIVEAATERGAHVGNAPAGVAAAAIYTAARLHDEARTQHEIAAVAKVTDVTIRKRCAEQDAALGTPSGRERD